MLPLPGASGSVQVWPTFAVAEQFEMTLSVVFRLASTIEFVTHPPSQPPAPCGAELP